MRAKRAAFFLIAIAILFVLASCGKSSAATGVSKLSGESADILNELVEKTGAVVEASGEFMYMSMTLEVTAENSGFIIGISEADFDEYIQSAASSMAAIGSQAHQIIIIKAKDAACASQIKKLIAGKVAGIDGYDPMKWICVWPERVVAVESGSYVLLAASRNDIADAALTAFEEMAGAVGEADVFFEHSGD